MRCARDVTIISVAVRECIISAVTIERADLIHETLKLFGFKYIENSVTPVEKILRALLKSGVIAEENGNLRQGWNC